VKPCDASVLQGFYQTYFTQKTTIELQKKRGARTTKKNGSAPFRCFNGGVYRKSIRVGEHSTKNNNIMKKIAFFMAAATLLVGSVSAQKSMFEKGDQLFKVGIGYAALGFPIEVSYEKGFKEDFAGVKGLDLGLGGYFGYYGWTEDFSVPGGYGYSGYSYSWNYRYMIVGGRALAHYKFIDNFDTYFGVMLGYNIAKVTFKGPKEWEEYWDDLTPAAGGFAYSGVVGVRYEFNPKVGAYVEAGYGVANLTAGLAIKF
jgi:hypothetical protein